MKDRNLMKPHLKIDPWDQNRWDELEILNITIKHQTQRKIQPFTGEKIKSMRDNKIEQV